MSWVSETLADSPIWWARQDDTSGTTMTDAVAGGSHNGAYTGTYTLNQASLVLSDSNPAVDFAGAKGTVPGASWMNLSAFTVRVVITPDTVPGGSGYAFIAARDLNGTAGPWWVALKGGKVSFLTVTGGGITEFVGNAVLTAGNTYYIWCTYDGANMRIDINGAQDAIQAKTGTPTANSVDIVVGNWTAANLPFDGRIDETALFPALTGARTAAQYTAGTALSASGSLSLSGSAGPAAPAVASGSLSLSGSATLSQLASGTGSLTLSGSAAAGARSTATAHLDLSGTATTTTAGSATAHLELTGFAEAVRLYGTDTSNAFTGLSMGGRGLVFVTQAVVEPPFALGPSRFEKAIAFPEPDLVKGRPTFINKVVAKAAQHDQVLMDGQDITWFRADAPGDTPILVPGYETTEPFAYGASEQLVIKRTNSMFERYGTGELSFLFQGAKVQYRRVDEDGNVTDYHGIVFAVRPSQREWVAEVVGEVSGRASQILMQHPLVRKVFDIGALVKFETQGLGLHLSPHNGPHTGIRYPNFGGMDLQSYFQRLGALARTKHTQARALMPKVWGQPTWEFREIDTETIDFTIWPDGVRVDISGLADDLTQQPNTVFGNGVTPEGLHWANDKYPGYFQGNPQPYPFTDPSHDFGLDTTDADTNTGTGITTLVFKLAWMGYLDDDLSHLTEYTSDVADAVDQLKEDAGLPQNGTMTYASWQALWDTDVVSYDPQGARIFPIAQAPHVNAFLYSSNGSIIGRNPDWIPGTIRVDVEHDYGIATKPAAIANARSEIRLASGHQWAGEITLNDIAVFAGDRHTYDIDSLTTDDMMRARDIRPGMNGKIMYFDGSSVVVHIAGVKVGAADQYGARSVTLTADTGARDLYDLAAGLERNREASRSPYNEWLVANRPNRPVRNQVEKSEWFGRYPETVALAGDHWTEIPVIMGQQGTVNLTDLRMTIPTEFCYVVSTKRMFNTWLDGHLGSPFALDGDGRTVFEQDWVQDLFDDGTFLTVQGAGIQTCGFGWRHGYDENGDRTANPLTGTVRDTQTFSYATRSGFLPVVWLAIRPKEDTAIEKGRWFSALVDDIT